jgi:hypothetical protein
MRNRAPFRFARLSRTALPAVPLALAAIPSARAVIVFSDLGAGVTVTGSTKIYFDLDHSGNGAGSAGFASNTSAGFTGTDFKLYFKSGNAAKPYIASSNPSTGYVSINGSNFTTNFAANASLSPSNWTNGFVYLNNNASGSSPWPSGTTGYLGFYVATGGDRNYGWAQVTYSGSSLTLTSFAYDTVLNEVLHAGQIPEPASTTALAALLAGSVALHRRRQQNKKSGAPVAA